VDASSSPRFLGLLRVLNRHGIDFIVVGGVAALLEGAPILTLDLDVLIDRAPQNLDRVNAVLPVLRETLAAKNRTKEPAGE
jgi:hypothetical protein